MVKRRNEYPEPGELVVGKVKNINPYSAFVHLEEYGRDGMIHVSEIARKWVREIRNFVNEGDTVVCLVMEIDKDKGHVTLSLKRVSDRDRNRRLQEWKRDQKGEKLLKKVADKKDITLDEAYEDIGFDIQDNFRDMLEAFETVQTDAEALKRKGLDSEWVEVINTVAEENLEVKDIELQGILEATLPTSNAIDELKEVFRETSDEYDIDVKYISAPEYSVIHTTTDPKEGDKKLREAGDQMVRRIEEMGGEGEFRVEGRA